MTIITMTIVNLLQELKGLSADYKLKYSFIFSDNYKKYSKADKTT